MRFIPRPKPVAYILSDKIAFVQNPSFRAAWLRVSPAIVVIGCRQCGSKKGVPCHRNGVYGTLVHYCRRDDAKKEKLKLLDHTVVKYNIPPSI